MNKSIRSSHAIVLPDNLIISEREGVLFITTHLAEKVIVSCEFISLRDKFGHSMLKSERYSPGEIDNQWTDKIKEDFLKWIEQNPTEMKMTRAQLDEYMKKRTW